jgi:predicted nucleotidyltransferase
MLTIQEITHRLTPIFEQNGVVKAILFGSYAKGTATEDSDVDLVVETDPNQRAIRFYGIAGDIGRALEKEVDVIPSDDIIPNGKVDVEVAKSGVLIYQK